MQLSVILIGYNSWPFLEKNLASSAFLLDRPDVEMIYVDNASADGTSEKIRTLYPNIKIIQNAKNQGVAKARNQAVEQASGEYLWILDSDTEVNPRALEEMLNFMNTHPEVGLCGCKMYGQDGTVQDSCRSFPSISGKIRAGMCILAKKIHWPFAFPEPESYDKNALEPFEADYVIGACQLIRRSVQTKIGLLDEAIFYGPEDADFCLRIRLAGYKVYYLPQTSIYHAYQRVSSHHVFSKLNWMHICGLAYYFWKHRRFNPSRAKRFSHL